MYRTTPGGDTSTLAVVDLTLTGLSSKPFEYVETDLYFAYSDGERSYTHNQDSNIYGPSPVEDYTPFAPLQPLRVGSVKTGVTRRGLVILRMSSDSTPYLLVLAQHSSAEPLVRWALVSKKT